MSRQTVHNVCVHARGVIAANSAMICANNVGGHTSRVMLKPTTAQYAPYRRERHVRKSCCAISMRRHALRGRQQHMRSNKMAARSVTAEQRALRHGGARAGCGSERQDTARATPVARSAPRHGR